MINQAIIHLVIVNFKYSFKSYNEYLLSYQSLKTNDEFLSSKKEVWNIRLSINDNYGLYY